MKELLNYIQNQIQWNDEQNGKVIFNGNYQPLHYLESIDSRLMDNVKNLTREQLITMIYNYQIMQEDILNAVQDEIEKL